MIVVCNNLYAQPAANPIYVPFAPGGMSDKITRLVADTNSNYYVINKPGAQGQLAISEMIKNPGPIVLATSPFYVSNPIILKDALSYDPNNLEVIALLGDTIGALACNKKTNINSVADIVNYQGVLSFGTAVRGGSEHIITEVFLEKINKKQHTVVMYAQGGNKHLLDLLGGHIDCVFGNMATILPFITNDKITLILTTHQTGLVNNVPTWKKQFGTEIGIRNSTAIVVDKRWPPELKTKILNDFKEALISKEFKKNLENLGHTYQVIIGPQANDEVQSHNRTLRNFLNNNKQIKLVD